VLVEGTKVWAVCWVWQGVVNLFLYYRCEGTGLRRYHPRKIFENSDVKSCILVTTCCEFFFAFWKLRPRGWGPIHCWQYGFDVCSWRIDRLFVTSRLRDESTGWRVDLWRVGLPEYRRSPQITADHHRSPQITTADQHRPLQITRQLTSRPCRKPNNLLQITADHYISPDYF